MCQNFNTIIFKTVSVLRLNLEFTELLYTEIHAIEYCRWELFEDFESPFKIN